MPHRTLQVATVLFTAILLASCGLVPTPVPTPTPVKQPIDTGELGRTATQAVVDWIKSHPTDYARSHPSQTPYRILGSKVLSNDGSSALVAIFALVPETSPPFPWPPKETVVELRNSGGNWTAQPIRDFESPFVATLLTAENAGAACSNRFPPGARPSNGYLCIRLTNKGHFDWKWDKLHWSGTAWGGSFTGPVSLPPGGSVDLSYSTWEHMSESELPDIGLEDYDEKMQVVLLPLR